MAWPNPRDEELMIRVADGDQEALSLLIRRYANPMLTFIRRMVGNRHSSEELFQEVFLAVWQERRAYQYPRPLRSWLFGIAVNKCRGTSRRAAVPLVQSPSHAALAASTEPSPVETAVAAETATLVQNALLTLPERQRSVVVLRIWNGFSYGEIAASLACLESTARSHMRLGLEAMRRILEPRLR